MVCGEGVVYGAMHMCWGLWMGSVGRIVARLRSATRVVGRGCIGSVLRHLAVVVSSTCPVLPPCVVCCVLCVDLRIVSCSFAIRRYEEQKRLTRGRFLIKE